MKSRIVELARREGKQLKQLSSFVKLLEQREERLNRLDGKANQKIESYSVLTGVGVAVNPVPVLDLAGGAFGAGKLLYDLAELYGIEVTEDEVKSLWDDLWRTGLELIGKVVLANIGGSLLKLIPGVGTVLGAVVQGGSAGYFVYVLGMAGKVYFSHGKKWKDGMDMKATLEQIISSVDKDAITARISDQIKKKLS